MADGNAKRYKFGACHALHETIPAYILHLISRDSNKNLRVFRSTRAKLRLVVKKIVSEEPLSFDVKFYRQETDFGSITCGGRLRRTVPT